MQLQNWSLTCWIFWKGEPVILRVKYSQRCATLKIMRLALIFLICAAGFFQGGYAQAPGTLDPAKAASKQDPPPPDSSKPDLSKQDSGDLTIRTNVNVVIAPTTVRDRSGEF